LVGVFNLGQAAVYIGLAVMLAPRFMPGAVLAIVAACAQVFAGVWLLLGKSDPRPVRAAAGGSLVVVAFVVGLFLQVVGHLVSQFMPLNAVQGWQLFAGVAAALPWLGFFPLWQFLTTPKSDEPRGPDQATAALVFLAVLLPPAYGWNMNRVVATYASVDGHQVGRWVHNKTTPSNQVWLLPQGPGPVLGVVTLVAAGVVIDSQTIEGATVEEALASIDIKSRERHTMVYLDWVVEEGALWTPWLAEDASVYLRPAETGLRTEQGIIGSLEVWRSKGSKPRTLLPRFRVPSVDTEAFEQPATGWVRVESWSATRAKTHAMKQTWTAPQELTADSALDAAYNGGLHLARNQNREGKYGYVVRHPDGRHGKGYNFPRHAGVTWFLARIGQRTDDPEIYEAARDGLNYLGDHTVAGPGGAAYVLEPNRTDGQVWTGTTALSLLAAIVLEERDDLRDQWLAHVVASVDADGAVRGNFDREAGTWPQQKQSGYAQGQGMLALAVAAREGLPGALPALERVADHVESGGYWPRVGGQLFTLDEHWTCLAALVAEDVLERPAGSWLCDAYLDQLAFVGPVDGAPFPLTSGAVGGLAEAYVARAEMDRRAGRDSPHLAEALRYGRVFLNARYHAEDRRMLMSGRLLGGFRNSPWRPDVRMDSVQHIGSALMGMEQLLRGQSVPGGMP